eukprot:3571576-Pleurochrysis_carterae.AAC.1
MEGTEMGRVPMEPNRWLWVWWVIVIPRRVIWDQAEWGWGGHNVCGTGLRAHRMDQQLSWA